MLVVPLIEIEFWNTGLLPASLDLIPMKPLSDAIRKSYI